MAISQNHIINIQPGVSAPLVIHCSQGDTGTQINLTVVNGDEVFDCSSYVCSVHGVRSDGGNWGPITCTVSGSTVCFSLTSAMTAVAGACLAEISVGTVGTANFAMLMENATFGNGVTYSNDVSVYQNILNAVQAEKNERIQNILNAVQAEKNERIAAVTNEKNERIAAVTNEKNERIYADNSLSSRISQNDARIDNLILSSGNESSAEVIDARTGYDGTAYTTLGTAIRTQVNNLNSALDGVSNIFNEETANYKLYVSGEKGFGFPTIINNSVEFDSTSYYIRKTINVKAGEIYCIKSKTGNSELPYLILLNDDVVIKAFVNKENNTAVIRKIEIPNNVNKLIVVTFFAGIDDYANMCYKMEPNIPVCDANKEILNTLNYSFNTVNLEIKQGFFDVLLNRGIIKLENSTYWYYSIVNVSDGETYKVSINRAGNKNVGYYIAFVSDDDFILGVDIESTETVDTIEKIITVPQNATKMYVKQFKTFDEDSVKKRIWLSANPVSVSFPIGVKPHIYRASIYSVAVKFPDIGKCFVKQDNEYSTLTYNTLEYSIPNNNVLVYSRSLNTFIVKNDSDIQKDECILLHNSYGRCIDGEWIKYIEDSGIPYYYNDHLKNKLREIIAEENVLINGDVFAFVTDLHVQYNNMTSATLIDEIYKNTSLTKTICGGDIVRAFGTKEELDTDIKKFFDSYGKLRCPLFSIRGNHDFFIANNASSSDGYTYSNSFAYNRIIKKNENNVDGVQGKLYYCLTSDAQKIRYICLNTSENFSSSGTSTEAEKNNYGVSTEQVKWFIDTLENTPIDYKNIVIGHIPCVDDISDERTSLGVLQSVMVAYKNRQSFNSNGLSHDFSQAKGELVMYLCGHTHYDKSAVVDGVLHVCTTCDATYQDDGYNRTTFSASENAIDVFFINTLTRTIKAIRVGAGKNREWTY